MGPTLTEAAWFLPVAAPIAVYVAWRDLRELRIPNHAVVALALGFAVIGALALPLPEYLWRYSHLAALLVIGMAANAAGLMGGGDAKFLAAAAPFVALPDLALILYLMAGCFLLAFVLHRIARASPLRRLTPEWKSWTSGKRFPMGVALGLTLLAYLAFPLWGGSVAAALAPAGPTP